jgi:hypothetical protein
MAQFPKIGLKYEYVRDRLKKYDSINRFGNMRMKNSLIRQAKLCEGEGAANELEKEFSGSTVWGYSLSGSGNKQVGWGEGKKLGDGKWIYKNGSWSREY